jgi:hypothetical protein
MRLLTSIIELIDAKAALLREEASTLQLGTYVRGYEEGRTDLCDQYGLQVAFVGDEDDEE